MFVVYFAYYELWPLLLTTTCSVFLSLSIGILKIYLEEFSPQKRDALGDDENPVPLGAALLPADQLGEQDQRDSQESNGIHKQAVRGSTGKI